MLKSAESAHLFTVHVIWDELPVPILNNEHQISVWMNGNYAVLSAGFAKLPEQMQKADTMLKDPLLCTIVIKNPDGQ